MQLAVKEFADFSSCIQDNPLELLIEVKKLTHVSKKVAHPILMLGEALAGMLSLRQGDKEGLLGYHERFKSEKMYSWISLERKRLAVTLKGQKNIKICQMQIPTA